MSFKDHFSRQSQAYSRYRPGYPPELIAWVAAQAPDRRLAVDCATGNGQAAVALAPVFLFSGIGVLLGVLTNRLARIVDRARKVEDNIRQAATTNLDAAREQLDVASRRARFMNTSITLSTIAALLIALVVALIFASTFVPMNLAAYIAVLFVLAMIALVCALLSFLVEVRIAIAALKIGPR
jgi:hypothetical protein